MEIYHPVEVVRVILALAKCDWRLGERNSIEPGGGQKWRFSGILKEGTKLFETEKLWQQGSPNTGDNLRKDMNVRNRLAAALTLGAVPLVG